MAGIFDFLKDLAIDLGVEFFSVGTMKKFITKTMAQKAIGGAEAKTQTAEGQTIDIKTGGLFNLSDEEAYLSLMAKLEISSDATNKKLAFLVSKGINEELPFEDQKQRFRVVFGRLSNIEYVKETEKTREEIQDPKAKPGTEPKFKEKTKEVKINLAVECLKSFVTYTPEERLEVYKAMGIMESELQRKLSSAKKWLDENGAELKRSLNSINKKMAGDPYEGLWTEMKKTLWPFGRKNKGA